MRFSGKAYLLSLVVSCLCWSLTWAGEFDVDSRDEGNLLKRKIRASQFLHYATFGPTMEDIDALALRMVEIGGQQAMSEWIDNQTSLPPTYQLPLLEQMLVDDGYVTTQDNVWIQRYRHHAWWENALNAEDQLRQRMAWALAQIVVTSGVGDDVNDLYPGNVSQKGRWLGPTHYYDMLLRHSFGNYRELLTDATYHPVMGSYLSHLRNRKSDGTSFPDENYAREVMQLFTIGLYELHKDGRLKTNSTGEYIPTYDNEDVKELARVFTGLTFRPQPGSTQNPFWTGNDFLYPMVMYQPEHDSLPKTLINNAVVNQGEGNAEIKAALDNLFKHDNIGPFIAYRLIQRFVKSNPSRAYILRVAKKFENNGQGVRGDLNAVVKAILLDPEPYQSLRIGSVRDANGEDTTVFCNSRGTEYSRLREPVIQYTAFLRGCNAVSDYPTGRAMITPLDWAWTQEPYRQPSVFSFYLPSFQPPGELIGTPASVRIPNGNLVAPEFQIKTAITSNRIMNMFIWNTSGFNASFSAGGPNELYNLRCNMALQLDQELELAAEATNLMDVVDRFDLLFCYGTMPQDFKNKLVQTIDNETSWMPGNNDWAPEYAKFRVQSALLATLTSPFAAVGE
jgi:uncharacterized protein (DUF1800 family)